MSKYELKELVIVLLTLFINLGIAYLITISLGVCNRVLYHSYTMVTIGDITYEVLILWVLSLIESSIYHFKFETVKE